MKAKDGLAFLAGVMLVLGAVALVKSAWIIGGLCLAAAYVFHRASR